MGNWNEIKDFLESNYRKDVATTMALLKGSGVAVEVEVDGGHEVMFVTDDDPFITIFGFICRTDEANADQILDLKPQFGIRKGNGNYVVSHVAWQETLDVIELQFPLMLMASEIRMLKNKLNI